MVEVWVKLCSSTIGKNYSQMEVVVKVKKVWRPKWEGGGLIEYRLYGTRCQYGLCVCVGGGGYVRNLWLIPKYQSPLLDRPGR